MARRPGRSLLLAAAVTATALVVGLAPVASAVSSAPETASEASAGPWVLSTTDPSTNYAPTFIGNGYLAARIPAEGAGFKSQPVRTESELAGFYANPPAETNWSEIRASLPTWTTLGLSAGTDRYGNLPICEFDQLCEAVAGQLSGGAAIASDHSGSVGGSFVAGFGYGAGPVVGAAVAVPIADASAGAANIGIRYANGNAGNETVSVAVDGAVPQQVSLPTTGNWDTWSTLTIPAQLNAGTNAVTVAVGSADSGQVNIDTISAYPSSDAAPTAVAQAQAGTKSGYRQALDMSTGTLTTSFTWTAPSGRTTDFSYTVNADQSDAHVGMVTMTFTPHWSGPATVVDALDGRGVIDATASSPAVDGANAALTETVTADGTGVNAAIASVLRINGSTMATTEAGGAPAAQSVPLTVVSGSTYTATKFVGIAASDDGGPGAPSTDPHALALDQASAAASVGAQSVTTRNDQAWTKLWTADISVPGDATLTGEIRASMFYLLESTRADVPWAMPPGGLSSDGYNGHVFWDMETWMYPALLAQHPDIAVMADSYRQALLAQAESNTTKCAPAGQVISGARFPWESALTGQDAYFGPGAYCDELHVTADIALAQWQYYMASGDSSWLTGKAWPLLRDTAEFWASRAKPDPNVAGAYQILDVMGPDEYHDHVNDSVYTNVAAQTVLRIAVQAAQLTGNTADPQWTTVADGLEVPFDSANRRHSEYDGYPAGQTIKQADVTMLQYPWGLAMSPAVAQNDLDYYGANTDPNGPSMTDSIASIDSAALSGPRCDSYTYMQRSVNPFMGAPFDQFHETNTGGAFTFTTAAGGFLQEFEYGFTGLRWNQNAVQLDPSLPPQLPGLDLAGLRWHGTTYSLAINSSGTTVSVTDGPALPVSIAGGAVRTVAEGTPMTVPTRNPVASSNRAQCKPVTTSSDNADDPAVAAVDGSPATAWHATTPGANLTVDLGVPTELDQVRVQADGPTSAYTIQGSTDDIHWTPLASQAAIVDSQSTAEFPLSTYRYLRYQADSSATARVKELTIPPTAEQIRLGDAGMCLDDRGGAGVSGDAVQVYVCNGTSAQTWVTAPDGTVRAQGLCLDVQDGATANDAPVQLYTCDSTGAQNWRIDTNGEVVNPQSGRCLTDPSSGGSSTRLVISDCVGGSSQAWDARAPVGPAVGYQGLCVDDRSAAATDYNPVQVFTCNATSAQQWTLANRNLQAYGKCLDVLNAGTANDTTVDLYSCNDSGAQQWEPQATGELINPESGRCLTDPDRGGSGTQLVIEDCQDTANQLWRLP